ncbi:MAG: glycosyltransferase N-terminal domain-containing protein [bacterium]
MLFFITYQVIQILLLPFFVIFLFLRKIKRKPVFGSFKERFGLIPKSPTNKKIIWIQAVSVGEVLSIQDLINKIKKEIPDSFCYLTVGTLSGKKIAQNKKIGDQISFLPYDLLPLMYLAYKRIKPFKIIIAEADIWPNFLYLAKLKKIPLFIINARMNDKSKNKYHKFRFIFKNLFNIAQKIFTQSEKDTNEFKILGVKKNKLETLGNIKIPNVLEKQKNTILPKINLNYPILLAGSIHTGEMDIYINLFKKLKITFSNLKIIIAPRHFHWQEELLEKLRLSQINFISWQDKYCNITIIEKLNNFDALIVLKLGELFNLYPFCNIFFLGGTFVPIGGHNLLEPAAWSKLSIIGPYDSNCRVIADELEKNNGLIRVKNENELFIQTKNLLENKKYIYMGKNAHDWLEKEAKIVNAKLNNFIEEL